MDEMRLTKHNDVGKALLAAESINDDGEDTGLQPYEIRFLLNLIKDERSKVNWAFRNMPYLAGMGFNASPAVNADRAVIVLKAAAEHANQVEAAHTALASDVAALRRVLGGYDPDLPYDAETQRIKRERG